MVFLLIILGLIIVLFILGYRAAKKAPDDWQGLIKKQFNYPLITIWDYISDIEGIPIRKRGIKRIEPLEKDGDSIIKWKEVTDMGGYILFEKTVIPYQRLEKRMTDSSFGMTGIWIYSIEGGEAGCTVTITEKSSTKKLFTKLMLVLAGRNANLRNEMRLLEKFALKSSLAVKRKVV